MGTCKPTKNPLVSVVIPAYNRGALISHSIESALAQTFRDFELIVVDDGSSDDTVKVVRSCNDPRIRLIEIPHQGISAAMNAGVRAARGPYYARLDSDDLWHPRFLERTLPKMEAGPEVGVVYPRGRTFSERAGAPQADRGRPMPFPQQPFHSMLLGDYAHTAALVRVACHERIGGYDESMLIWEDWDYWLRASRYYDFRFVDEVLAYFRVHPGSVSAGSADRWLSRTRVLDKVFAGTEVPQSDIRELRGPAYRNVYFEIGHAYWDEGTYKAALQWFRDGVRVSGEPARSAAQLGYDFCLHQMGKVPYFWVLHGALSRGRRAVREQVAGTSVNMRVKLAAARQSVRPRSDLG